MLRGTTAERGSPSRARARPVAPPFAGDVPQVLAIVEWDEGPHFSTEMVNVAPGDLAELNAIPAPEGTRYPEAMMGNVNR